MREILLPMTEKKLVEAKEGMTAFTLLKKIWCKNQI
jgi:hypothetical protein